MNNPEVQILVGLPGSGKSTYVNKLLHNGNNYVIISSDAIIEKKAKEEGKTYSEMWRKLIKKATKATEVELKAAISFGTNIIVDQTNLTVDKRKWILDQLSEGYYKVAVYFTTPMEEIEKRLEKREKETGKRIPVNTINDMVKKLEVPQVGEGFDEIILVS